MSSKYTINIIGYGFVGQSVGHLCKLNNIDFNIYDVLPKTDGKYFSSLTDMITSSETSDNYNVYFICVPTPSKDNGNKDNNNGECDTSIVENVIKELNNNVKKNSIVILKSTVTPGFSEKINNTIDNTLISYVFCPEFLREATYLKDVENAEFILIGCKNNETDEIKTTLQHIFNDMYKHKTKIECIFEYYTICELFKYTVNVFLAVKVWYFNEIDQICSSLGVEYQSLRNLFKLEQRIGESHTQVPGPDGKRMFGGKCLPKETKGMFKLQEKLNIPNSVFKEILKRNQQIRYNNYNDNEVDNEN